MPGLLVLESVCSWYSFTELVCSWYSFTNLVYSWYSFMELVCSWYSFMELMCSWYSFTELVQFYGNLCRQCWTDFSHPSWHLWRLLLIPNCITHSSRQVLGLHLDMTALLLYTVHWVGMKFPLVLGKCGKLSEVQFLEVWLRWAQCAQKITVTQLVRKFPACCETSSIIAVLAATMVCFALRQNNTDLTLTSVRQ
jgi:hypothetical protein